MIFVFLLIIIILSIGSIREGYSLSLQGARNACRAIGWNPVWTNPNGKSIVCTRGGYSSGHNCNRCDSWRLYVTQDGGCDMSPPGNNYCSRNKAGNYYCGHSPCQGGDNHPWGGSWTNQRYNQYFYNQDYAPTSTSQVIPGTYIGPSTEDRNYCNRIGRGHIPCGNPNAAKGSWQRCQFQDWNCRNQYWMRYPYYCGTCMKRVIKYKPIKQCVSGKQYNNTCSECVSGYQPSNDKKKCIPKAPAAPILKSNVKNLNVPGNHGDKGPRGEKGPRGKQGERGPRGADALESSPGWKGPKGEKGNVGPKGPKGFTGEKGETGDIGLPGYQGKETIYNPWASTGVLNELKKIKDKLSFKIKNAQVKEQVLKSKIKPVDVKIKIPKKSQGITYKKYLIDEKTKEIESFSVYPPNRRPQVLPDILESPIK